MLRRILILVLPVLAALLALSCTPPGTPTHYAIAGHVYDGMDGQPVSGATVRYGSASDTTGADGAFSVDLGTTAGVFSKPLGFSASGYSFMYVDPVRVDTADANELVVRLKPLVDTFYTVKTIHLRVYEADGITEITDATRVVLAVLPMNGLVGAAQTLSYDTGHYTLEINRHSADCLVLMWMERPDTTQSFSAHLTGVDLSGPEPIELDLTEPDAGYVSVALTADSIASTAEGLFVTPYGLLPVVCKYVDDDGGPTTKMDTSVEFSDGTTESVTVYNPGNWPCFWSQSGVDGTYGGSSRRALRSTTAIEPLASAVTLPALSAGLGPSSDPDLDSWAYDAATGEISIDAITDAQLYQFLVVNTIAYPSYTLGTIVTFNMPCTLPAWLNDRISADSPRSMAMMPMDTDLAAYELDFANRDTYPEDAHFGVLLSPGSFWPYSKEFSF